MKKTLRLPDDLIETLKISAIALGRSLNQEVILRLRATCEEGVKCGSDVGHSDLHVGQTWVTCGSDVGQMGVKRGSDVGHAPESTAFKPTPEEVDNMPADGDKMRPTSNYQKRRKAQMEMLRETYTEMFPGKRLTDLSAKNLLGAAGDSVCQVIEALGVAQERNADNPATYAVAVLRKTPKTDTKAEGKPYGDTGGWVIRDPTPEELAEDEAAKQSAIRRGLWVPDE